MLSIIVAVSENNVIGTGNNLPWKLSGDLQRVKKLTMGHHLIMGRKTYESIGRPLPGRITIIITRQTNYHPEGCTVVSSLADALKIAQIDSEAFIFGGGEIFTQALPFTHKIYFTKVHCAVNGDTFFPQLAPSEWHTLEVQNFPADEKNEFACTTTIFVRADFKKIFTD